MSYSIKNFHFRRRYLMWKKSLCVLLLVTCYLSAIHSQITTMAIATPKTTQTQVYDGSKNFLGDNVYLYMGEELYLNGKAKDLQEYGYWDFSKETPFSGIPSVPYDDFYGKYFIVEDVTRHPEASTESYLYGSKYYLKLREKDSNEVWYFEYDSKYEHSFPFIVVKYFNYLKEKYVGTQIVLRGKNWISSTGVMTDIYTGLPVRDFSAGAIWDCIDVTVEQTYYSLVMVLQNSYGEKIPFYIDNLEKYKNKYAFTKEQSDGYLEKFGEKIWNTILAEKVSIGMTKEMCQLSWGEPEKVNKTTTKNGIREQWVYYANYLYFEDGILTSIQ